MKADDTARVAFTMCERDRVLFDPPNRESSSVKPFGFTRRRGARGETSEVAVKIGVRLDFHHFRANAGLGYVRRATFER
jgi:hypothetical protein